MKNSSFKDGAQFAWDATSLTLASTCPRKYKYKMIDGWAPKGLSVHLLFGQHYATALERFFKFRAEGNSIDEATVRVVRLTLEETWDKKAGGPVEFDYGSANKGAKSRYTLIRSIVWYLDAYGEENPEGLHTFHLADGTPAVELSFSFEVEDGILLCGHLDRVSELAGSKFIVDQKTTGTTITPRYFDGFKPDNQMSLYTLAGKITLDTPIRGVMIDAAQIAVNFTKFERGFTYRTNDELEEWWQGAKNLIQVTQHYCYDDFFPMNTSACGNYGGCEFRRVCATAPRHRQSVLNDYYTQYKWDPLERR